MNILTSLYDVFVRPRNGKPPRFPTGSHVSAMTWAATLPFLGLFLGNVLALCFHVWRGGPYVPFDEVGFLAIALTLYVASLIGRRMAKPFVEELSNPGREYPPFLIQCAKGALESLNVTLWLATILALMTGLNVFAKIRNRVLPIPVPDAGCISTDAQPCR